VVAHFTVARFIDAVSRRVRQQDASLKKKRPATGLRLSLVFDSVSLQLRNEF
jgi:hypothetical protein